MAQSAPSSRSVITIVRDLTFIRTNRRHSFQVCPRSKGNLWSVSIKWSDVSLRQSRGDLCWTSSLQTLTGLQTIISVRPLPTSHERSQEKATVTS